MCNICNSLYGHFENCPENFSSLSSTYCYSCEHKLERGEKIAVFQNERIFCQDCVNNLDISEFIELLEVDDTFSLIEKFELCKTEELDRFSR